MTSLQPYAFPIIISIISLTIFFVISICIYRYVRRTNKNRLISSSSASITSNHFIYPLTRLSNPDTIETNSQSSSKIIHETFSQFSLNEIPSNYKTFDFSKRSRQHFSSDSSYTSSTNCHSPSQSYSFGTIKSKFQENHSISSPNSESHDIDIESINRITPSFEYSLLELFHIELIYKLYYLTDDNQLIFEIIRLIPTQSLTEQCFSSFLCKIRLFINNDKYKNKKYFSKPNPINESFKFNLNEINLKKSYLKIHILANNENEKNLELGQTVLLINQYNHLMINSQQYTKSIQIYEDRIDMIIRQQV
jgi:hypothetical protein